jgi:fructose-1,6-bisphosphatase
MAISTDTQTLEKLSGMISDKLKDCHLKCNKEAEIAVLATKVDGIEEKVGKMDEKLDRIDKYVTTSQAEKNTITGVVAFVSGLVGIWWGGKA